MQLRQCVRCVQLVHTWPPLVQQVHALNALREPYHHLVRRIHGSVLVVVWGDLHQPWPRHSAPCVRLEHMARQLDRVRVYRVAWELTRPMVCLLVLLAWLVRMLQQLVCLVVQCARRELTPL